MLSVLIVANSIHKDGGIGRCLYNMITEMYKEHSNFSMTLLLFDRTSNKYAEELNKQFGLNIMYMERDNELSSLSIKELIKKIFKGKASFSLLLHRFLYKLSYRLPLINDIAKSYKSIKMQYDVAIAYNCIPSIVTSYVSFQVKARKKIVWAHISIDQKKACKYGRESTLKIYGIKRYKTVLDSFNKIYAVSKGVKESLLNEINRKLNVDIFYNFVNKKDAIEKSTKTIDLQKNDKETIILTAGRLSFEKGIKLSLKTIKKLKKNGYTFKWVYIGYISKSDYVKKYVKKNKLEDRIIIVGNVNNPYPYFNACDIYVHTSYVEGYCTATNEARMFGKAVVTTCVAGAEEQIKNGINGFVVKNNVNDIYNSVVYLITDATLRYSFEEYNKSISFDNKEALQSLNEMFNFMEDN